MCWGVRHGELGGWGLRCKSARPRSVDAASASKLQLLG